MWQEYISKNVIVSSETILVYANEYFGVIKKESVGRFFIQKKKFRQKPNGKSKKNSWILFQGSY